MDVRSRFYPNVARLERDALVLGDACAEMKTISSLVHELLLFAMREAHYHVR